MAQNETLSKSDLIDQIASEADMAKKDVKTVVDHFLESISNQLNSGGRVQLTGFGTFEVRERQAREGVKPGTSEKIQIPASKAPAFKAGKSLKEVVNS